MQSRLGCGGAFIAPTVKNVIRFLIKIIFVLIGGAHAALAAPSASCAHKFVGSWMVRVIATGQTAPAVISPNGTTHITCPMCNPTGTWTCSGNTIMILAPTPVSHTISADGKTMSGGCCVLTRIGGGPTVAAKGGSEETTKNKAEQKFLPAKVQSTAAAKPITPSNSGRRKSASCSDITGTNSTAPAANDCKDAVADRELARTNRKNDPELSKYKYKKAAESARRAGDADLELSILREAETPPSADKPDADRDSNLRDAQTYLTAAKAGEENDATCTGLTNAAENYLQSAKFFLRANEVKKTDELLLRHDTLIALVDKAKAEGRCNRVREATNQPVPSSSSKQPELPPNECHDALDQVKQLATPSANMSSVDTDKAAVDDKALRQAATLSVKLAARGCHDSDSKPFTGNECLGARNDIIKSDNLSISEANEIIAKAGCAPLGKQ
jgi:hypothetical protein